MFFFAYYFDCEYNEILKKNLQWVCHHAHLDKSLTMTQKRIQMSNVHMQDKWFLMKDIKENYTRQELAFRMDRTIRSIVSQNCNHIRSFIDVDNVVGLTCVEEAVKLKEKWKKRGVHIQLATQPLDGLVSKQDNIALFEKQQKCV